MAQDSRREGTGHNAGPDGDLPDLSETRIVREAVNAHLIGDPCGRKRLNTPALLIDIDAMRRNLTKMAERCARAGVALRPHAKTHKCPQIARLQMEAGASGICVAKIGEAEAMAGGGVRRLLVTSPIAGEEALRRCLALAPETEELILAIDHPASLARLEAAAGEAGIRMPVVVDIDVGLKRTGTRDPGLAEEMAARAAASPSLIYRGVQAYGGHLQHIAGRATRHEATAKAMEIAGGIVAHLKAKGLDPELITGGGTGTHLADFEQSVLNEVQPGSYLFMDRQYREALGEDEAGAFETALLIQTTVISANASEWFTVDGGTKCFSTDGPAPEVRSTRYAGADFIFMGDEHGAVLRREDSPEPQLGERIEFAAPHCDPTINLHDFIHLVRGDELIGIWPVSARGASF